MKSLTYILFFLMSLVAVAQVAPSPDAMGVANGPNPEDLYRAYVSEIVPIYTIEAENGFQVPINLTYQTRGIRVDDAASSVGLGWNLIAGGAITRIMRDQPDDQSTFTENINATIIEDDQVFGDEGYDFEKDIFYLSYPGGGAQFLSTASTMSGNATTRNSFYGMPYTDLKIAFYKTNNLNSYFRVTDLQGITYVFGESAEAREVTTTASHEEGESHEDNEYWTYISTWYLERSSFQHSLIPRTLT